MDEIKESAKFFVISNAPKAYKLGVIRKAYLDLMWKVTQHIENGKPYQIVVDHRVATPKSSDIEGHEHFMEIKVSEGPIDE